MARQSNYYAPDGYRYGVMFDDGSVRNKWNGPTQAERAQECAANILLQQITYAGRTDNITVARKHHTSDVWERIETGGQCHSAYAGVWRCLLAQDHPSVHESPDVDGSHLYWTHDMTIMVRIQSKKADNESS